MRQPSLLLTSALSALLFVACGDDSAAGGGPALELVDAGGSADTATIDTGSVGTDTSVDDTEGADTTVEDTTLADTNGSADTTVEDTTVEDTNGSADTAVEDTDGSADTTVEDTTDTTVEDTTLPPADIIINEVSCRGGEWIELLNLSDRDQDLSNWRIADGPIDLNPGFLNGKVIPALGRLILNEGTAAMPFAISCSGEVIRLSDDRLSPIDIFSFGVVPPGATAGRIPDGLGEFTTNIPTQGAPNLPYNADDSALYDPLNPFLVEITLPPTSLTLLNADGRTYVPADVAITLPTGEVVFAGSTGVRLKGSVGSYRNLDGKAGFKVDLGQYDGAQALFGAQKFTFNNCVQDPSYVRQWATYEVLRQSGFPAPRVGYANIYVNGELYGLYLHLETTDESFVNRYFPNTKLLYEGQIPTDFDLDNWTSFQRDIGSATDGALLANLINVLGTLPRAETWAVAEPFVDRDQVALDFAVEAWVGHWDGYAFNNNNFFAHFDGTDDKLRMFTWGVDQTLSDYIDPYRDGARLQRGCLANADCRLLYSQKLLSISAAVRASDIPNQMLAIFAALTPDMLADPRRERSQTRGEEVRDEAYSFLLGRPDDVDAAAFCEADPASDPDGDGYRCAGDCAPDDPTINPSAIDICGDGIDQDCSGRADDAIDCPDCVAATRLGRNYAMCFRPRTFADARLACQAIGLDLAVPGSRGENTFLQGLLSGGATSTSWLGLTDAAVEGTWRTVAGAALTFTSWEAGEPNNAGNQDCTQMYTSGNWDDLGCGSLLSALCEQP
jgi:hypothetical protein